MQAMNHDEHGRTPLHQAAIEGDWKAVEELLGAGADANARDFWGRTPLLLAVYEEILVLDYDRLTTAQLLLRRGADVNARDVEGDTPLHMAALGDSRMVNLLLEYGADSNSRNAKGETPQDIATRLGEDKIVARLAESGNKVVAAR